MITRTLWGIPGRGYIMNVLPQRQQRRLRLMQRRQEVEGQALLRLRTVASFQFREEQQGHSRHELLECSLPAALADTALTRE